MNEHYKNLSLENIPNEIWTDIQGFEKVYEISNFGRIKILKRYYLRYQKHMGTVSILVKEKILKQSLNQRGYCFFFPAKKKSEKKRKSQLTHRAVAEAFIGKSDLSVNHKSNIKTDNRVENLEWMSVGDNVRLAYAAGVHKNTRLRRFGKDNPTSKSVIQYNLDGRELARFYSVSEAANILGCHPSSISDVCKKRPYNKTACGYKWAFANQ